MAKELRLYAARDKSNGKLVAGITNPSKKFWQQRRSCIDAIDRANRERLRYGIKYRGELELVIFKLVEVNE